MSSHLLQNGHWLHKIISFTSKPILNIIFYLYKMNQFNYYFYKCVYKQTTHLYNQRILQILRLILSTWHGQLKIHLVFAIHTMQDRSQKKSLKVSSLNWGLFQFKTKLSGSQRSTLSSIYPKWECIILPEDYFSKISTFCTSDIIWDLKYFYETHRWLTLWFDYFYKLQSSKKWASSNSHIFFVEIALKCHTCVL